MTLRAEASTRPAPARCRPGRRRARSCSRGPASRSSPRGCSRRRPSRARRSAASPRRCRWRRHRPAGAQDVVADRDPALAVEAAGAAEEVDPAFFEPGQLGGVVEVVDHLVAASEDRLRVELAVAASTGTPGSRRASASSVGGPQQRLRGHAGVVGAFAADQVLLDDRDAQPAVGQPARADLAGGPGAEHDRVVFPLAHTDTIPDTVQFQAQHARGRQASTWSIRANGCRSRLPEASLNPGTNQYVRTMSSPSPLS